MALIQFVRNYEDLSTDRGYQFKFNCDKCGNGYLSRFQPSVIGTAGSLLRAAGNFLGGWVSTAGNSSYEIQRSIGGSAHDEALDTAVQEGKQHFKQCSRCGKWVCPEVCWNHKAGQCEECAPDFHEEMASSQAHAKAEAARSQLYEKAQQTDYTSHVYMGANSVLQAPGAQAGAGPGSCTACGATVTKGKFCPECGSPVKPAKLTCASCGHQPETPGKFCPECGGKLA